MSKRDYEMIASVLHIHAMDGEVRVIAVARSLAGMFGLDNPRFDYDRFMKAVLP